MSIDNDQIQRFMFDQTAVRGELVTLHDSFGEVLQRHHYSPDITRELGQLLAAVALLTATVKIDGTLSLEVRGKGPVSLLMAESNPGGQLRAIARYDEQTVPAGDFQTLLGGGQLVITIDPKEGRRYQGIVALDQPDLASCLEAYFSQSEQLPSKLWLAANEDTAAGFFLQRLPDDEQNQDPDAWERLTILAQTLTSEEMLTLPQATLLTRLFHEEPIRVFEPRTLHFGCTCSRERLAQAVLNIGATELRDIIAEQGAIKTQCHFCNTPYEFSASEVDALIDGQDAPTLH